MASRTRMTPEQRQGQLLDLGAELFASHPYDEVHIERVAELAGVSRGLLYHYFPSKRDFFVALLTRENAALMARTSPDPALSPLEQLGAGVNAFLDHCRSHEFGVRAVFRGAVSSDADIVAIIANSIDEQVDRILLATGGSGDPDPMLLVALRSWIYMLRAAAYEMLSDKRVHPDAVAQMCLSAFFGALSGLPAEVLPVGMRAVLDSLEPTWRRTADGVTRR